jgi:hypothetical protein
MKTILFALILFLSSCIDKTEHGDCVGIWDEKNSGLVYKPSINNIVAGILFFEFVLPPVEVAIDKFYCPVGKR